VHYSQYNIHHQHANARGKDGWYKEDGWKGMLRIKLRAKWRELGEQREKNW
jgi:hypothetical protein